MAAHAADEETAVAQAEGSEDGTEAKPPAAPVELDLRKQVPFETYNEMREKGPVVRVTFAGLEELDTERAREFRQFMGRENHFVTQYEDVATTLADDRFSVDPKAAMTPEQIAKLPPVSEDMRPFTRSLLGVDPPDHTRLRKLVQPSFTARAMESLKPRVQQIADELLDKADRAAAERGERAPDRRMDLVESFAYPLPVTVISDMLGIPKEDRPRVQQWTEKLFQGNRMQNRGFDDATRKAFVGYLRELFDAKRKSPTDDLISQMVQAQEDGDKLDGDELLSMVFILFIAGHVTTVNLIASGTVALLTNPDQLAKLKADPAGMARGVVEETLRYWSPVDFISRRIAKEDLEVHGTPIAKGEYTMFGLASANRDPARFPNPDAFDISRPDADRHVAFGKGIHVCLGAPLARVEGQIAFETLIRRYPDLRLAVPGEEMKFANSFLRGFSKVPVLF